MPLRSRVFSPVATQIPFNNMNAPINSIKAGELSSPMPFAPKAIHSQPTSLPKTLRRQGSAAIGHASAFRPLQRPTPLHYKQPLFQQKTSVFQPQPAYIKQLPLQFTMKGQTQPHFTSQQSHPHEAPTEFMPRLLPLQAHSQAQFHQHHHHHHHADSMSQSKAESRIQCSICSTQVNSLEDLRQHTKAHVGAKSFTCPECGKIVSRKDNFITHLRIHTGERPFACLICGKEFSQRGSLSNHHRTHSTDKPFQCPQCCKSFKWRGSLVRHLSSLHS